MGEKNTITDEKKNIRKRILSLRNEMPFELREEKSNQILRTLYGTKQYQEAEILLAYVDYQSEVLTTPLLTKALTEKKQVFAPRVSGEEMEFYRILGMKDLAEGYKGIREPIATCDEGFLDAAASSSAMRKESGLLMLMPGTAFDTCGYRIGYGKGFYDRYLKRLMEAGIHVYKIALCYECQLLNEVPHEAHDICADMIITENGVK